MGKAIFWIIAIVVVAGVIGGLSRHPTQAPRSAMASAVESSDPTCLTHLAQLSKLLNDGLRQGFLRSKGKEADAAFYEVDETLWTSLTHDAKIGIAMAAYCVGAESGGRGTAILTGLHDGQTKASVVDGNYSDG